MLAYDRLTVRIEPAPETGRYEVLVNGEAGEGHGSFDVPFDARDVENFVLRMSRGRRATRRIETSDERQAKEFGHRLFDALFQGEVRDIYRSSLADARRSNHGLRVTLALTKAPQLMDLPWEYLFDDPDFLAASIWTPVVRYLDVAKPAAPLAVPPPLRILGMISRADDLPELDVEGERRRLEQALWPLTRSGRIEVHWTQEATLESLLRKLRAGDFHIFHFVGHGAYDDARGDGVLLLAGEDGRSVEVSGQRLARILNDHHPMRLAVLNACEGARVSETDPFAGVAASLVLRGLPAVVAMQFEITDTAALTFAEHFYAGLARGYSVDAATAQARQGIYASGNDVEWGTPVLFLRPADGRIFDLEWEEVRSPAAALAATLEAHPVEAREGEPVTWSLYVQNTGKPSLFRATPEDADGTALCEPTDLLSGEYVVFTWESVATADGAGAVTVVASTADGAEVRAPAEARLHVRRPQPAVEDERPAEREEVGERPAGREEVGERPAGREEVRERPARREEVEERPARREEVEERPARREEAEAGQPAAEAVDDDEETAHRPGRLGRHKVSLAAAAVAVVALAVAVVLFTGGGDPPAEAEDTEPIALPGAPNALAAVGDRLWVSMRAGTVGVTPSGDLIRNGQEATQNGRTIAAAEGSLWVPIPTADRVVRLDARSGHPVGTPLVTGGRPKAIALAAGAVYVSESDGADTWVQRYDPGTGEPDLGRIRVPTGTERILVREGALWVLVRVRGPGDDSLLRYDAETGVEQASIAVGAGAKAMTSGGGALWVTSEDAGELARVDLESLAVVTTKLGGEPANVRFGLDGVWVSNPAEGLLQHVDPGSGEVTPVEVGPHPFSLAITGKGIWVGDTGDKKLRFVRP